MLCLRRLQPYKEEQLNGFQTACHAVWVALAVIHGPSAAALTLGATNTMQQRLQQDSAATDTVLAVPALGCALLLAHKWLGAHHDGWTEHLR